ncbi:MAG: DUF1573 domain-containing protein [Prevotella sp.]|jgi:hypothetical protein|nr:DUF1573 domain-containing protein [Prevotella sp.]
MKKILTFTLLLSLMVGITACGDRKQSAPGNVKPTKAVFGVLGSNKYYFEDLKRKDRKVKHTFTVKNVGTDPLVINDVKLNCSCLKADYTKKPIAPNQTGEVTLTVMLDKLEDGHFRRVVYVYSNDKDSPFPLELFGDL